MNIVGEKTCGSRRTHGRAVARLTVALCSRPLKPAAVLAIIGGGAYSQRLHIKALPVPLNFLFFPSALPYNRLSLMSDPLSVAASIVGILAASGKLYELTTSFVSTAKDAPKSLVAFCLETTEMQGAITRLQHLLKNSSSVPSQLLDLVQLDHLVASLTDTVNVYSDLDELITPFLINNGGKLSFIASAKWTLVEPDCKVLVDRLQRRKTSIILMLNIFLW